jgi:hypothetical protein
MACKRRAGSPERRLLAGNQRRQLRLWRRRLPGLHQWVDTTTFDTYWVQATAPAPTAGSLLTINDQWTSDRWNLAAVEVYPAG